MRGKSIIRWLLVVAAVAVPLLLSSSAFAESGCHRSGNGGNNPAASGDRAQG